MSNCSASCTSVRSPLIAAIATFALKADAWFRRGLLLMLSPDSRAKSCPLSGRSSTYRPVQILEAGSGNPYFQYFCGEEFFQHALVFDRSSLTRWRQRMGGRQAQGATAGEPGGGDPDGGDEA